LSSVVTIRDTAKQLGQHKTVDAATIGYLSPMEFERKVGLA
jgi:hypothetical protein